MSEEVKLRVAVRHHRRTHILRPLGYFLSDDDTGNGFRPYYGTLCNRSLDTDAWDVSERTPSEAMASSGMLGLCPICKSRAKSVYNPFGGEPLRWFREDKV